MLEHPIVTDLYDNVISGNWSYVELLLQIAADQQLFDDCIRAYDPKARWQRLNGPNPDGDIPTSRGGHQMCIDSDDGIIYIFGGWDGKKNLDDLWSYSIAEGRWKLLSPSTALDGGPGPRSCHKMVFDPVSGCIYLLGCLDDGDGRRSPSPSGTVTPAHAQNSSGTVSSTDTTANTSSQGVFQRPSSATEGSSKPSSLPSQFYRYITRGLNAGTWTLLSMDTKVRLISKCSSLTF